MIVIGSRCKVKSYISSFTGQVGKVIEIEYRSEGKLLPKERYIVRLDSHGSRGPKLVFEFEDLEFNHRF